MKRILYLFLLTFGIANADSITYYHQNSPFITFGWVNDILIYMNQEVFANYGKYILFTIVLLILMIIIVEFFLLLMTFFSREMKLTKKMNLLSPRVLLGLLASYIFMIFIFQPVPVVFVENKVENEKIYFRTSKVVYKNGNFDVLNIPLVASWVHDLMQKNMYNVPNLNINLTEKKVQKAFPFDFVFYRLSSHSQWIESESTQIHDINNNESAKKQLSSVSTVGKNIIKLNQLMDFSAESNDLTKEKSEKDYLLILEDIKRNTISKQEIEKVMQERFNAAIIKPLTQISDNVENFAHLLDNTNLKINKNLARLKVGMVLNNISIQDAPLTYFASELDPSYDSTRVKNLHKMIKDRDLLAANKKNLEKTNSKLKKTLVSDKKLNSNTTILMFDGEENAIKKIFNSNASYDDNFIKRNFIHPGNVILNKGEPGFNLFNLNRSNVEYKNGYVTSDIKQLFPLDMSGNYDSSHDFTTINRIKIENKLFDALCQDYETCENKGSLKDELMFKVLNELNNLIEDNDNFDFKHFNKILDDNEKEIRKILEKMLFPDSVTDDTKETIINALIEEKHILSNVTYYMFLMDTVEFFLATKLGDLNTVICGKESCVLKDIKDKDKDNILNRWKSQSNNSHSKTINYDMLSSKENFAQDFISTSNSELYTDVNLRNNLTYTNLNNIYKRVSTELGDCKDTNSFNCESKYYNSLVADEHELFNIDTIPGVIYNPAIVPNNNKSLGLAFTNKFKKGHFPSLMSNDSRARLENFKNSFLTQENANGDMIDTVVNKTSFLECRVSLKKGSLVQQKDKVVDTINKFYHNKITNKNTSHFLASKCGEKNEKEYFLYESIINSYNFDIKKKIGKKDYWGDFAEKILTTSLQGSNEFEHEQSFRQSLLIKMKNQIDSDTMSFKSSMNDSIKQFTNRILNEIDKCQKSYINNKPEEAEGINCNFLSSFVGENAVKTKEFTKLNNTINAYNSTSGMQQLDNFAAIFVIMTSNTINTNTSTREIMHSFFLDIVFKKIDIFFKTGDVVDYNNSYKESSVKVSNLQVNHSYFMDLNNKDVKQIQDAIILQKTLSTSWGEKFIWIAIDIIVCLILIFLSLVILVSILIFSIIESIGFFMLVISPFLVVTYSMLHFFDSKHQITKIAGKLTYFGVFATFAPYALFFTFVFIVKILDKIIVEFELFVIKDIVFEMILLNGNVIGGYATFVSIMIVTVSVITYFVFYIFKALFSIIKREMYSKLNLSEEVRGTVNKMKKSFDTKASKSVKSDSSQSKREQPNTIGKEQFSMTKDNDFDSDIKTLQDKLGTTTTKGTIAKLIEKEKRGE